MRRLAAYLLIALLAAGGAAAQNAPRVAIGDPSWLGARIMARLIGHVAREMLGVEVDYVPRANAGIWAAMDAGRGEIDVHPDVWLPNQQSFVDAYVTDRHGVALSEGGYDGRSGFCVPTEFARAHAIRTVSDLRQPRLRGLFDGDGDGIDEIWIGEEGWASTNVNKVKIRDYGLDALIACEFGSELAFLARLDGILARGEGAVFYCYSPHYIQALYDLTMLEEPPYDPADYVVVMPDQDADWFAKSRIATENPPNRIVVARSTSLDRRVPVVARFLTRIDMTAEDLALLAYEVEVERRGVETVVAAWVAEHPGIIADWLGPDAGEAR